MIEALLSLLACQLVGEVVNRLGLLPLPGPVTGLGLLFLVLCWRGRSRSAGTQAVPHELASVVDTLLRHLSLLYVPACVGIVERLDLLRAHPVAIGVAIVVSTIVAQGVTALVFEHMLRWRAGHRLTASGQIR